MTDDSALVRIYVCVCVCELLSVHYLSAAGGPSAQGAGPSNDDPGTSAALFCMHTDTRVKI